MTEDDLVEYVRDNYGPGDVFDGPDLEDWADHNNTLYEKCADCHLFVEPNGAADDDPTLAPFVHLHRGDAADEALDASHEARPSGMRTNLAVWRAYGPEPMRARFTD